jgi:hypothetical protein
MRRGCAYRGLGRRGVRLLHVVGEIVSQCFDAPKAESHVVVVEGSHFAQRVIHEEARRLSGRRLWFVMGSLEPARELSFWGQPLLNALA